MEIVCSREFRRVSSCTDAGAVRGEVNAVVRKYGLSDVKQMLALPEKPVSLTS
jgi:hypothetical protein